jgi:hypothetical protein
LIAHDPPQQEPDSQDDEASANVDDVLPAIAIDVTDISLVCFNDPHEGQMTSSATSRTLWKISYPVLHSAHLYS